MAAGLPFNWLSAPSTLDGTGAATIDFYAPAGVLVVERVTVSVSSNTKEPKALLYRNGQFIEGTYSGSNDSTGRRVELSAGGQLSCVWSGGDVAAKARLRVEGTHYPTGKGR